jgi:hypothetical protein
MKLLFILYGLLCNATRIKILCNNCKHFVPSVYKDQYALGGYNGKCSKFITIEGEEIDYAYTIVVRKEEDKCGIEAKHFVKKNSSMDIVNMSID